MTLASTPYRRYAAWLPLALLVAVLLLSLASGRSWSPAADAATVDITGSVDADIYIDPSGCGASAVVIGDLLPGDPWKTAQDEGGQTCYIDFGTTNHLAGTTLSMLEDPAAPATPADAMKCVAASCTGDAIPDYDNAAEPAANTSGFGAQLLSSNGIATAIWSGGSAVHAVSDAASPACSTPGVGTGTCEFTWGASATTSDSPGAYQAQARLLVIGN